jgi:hypothetical protein
MTTSGYRYPQPTANHSGRDAIWGLVGVKRSTRIKLVPEKYAELPVQAIFDLPVTVSRFQQCLR